MITESGARSEKTVELHLQPFYVGPNQIKNPSVFLPGDYELSLIFREDIPDAGSTFGLTVSFADAVEDSEDIVLREEKIRLKKNGTVRVHTLPLKLEKKGYLKISLSAGEGVVFLNGAVLAPVR